MGATELAIRTIFEQYGAVRRVGIARDRITGQRRGFAYVEMTIEEEGKRAVGEIHGHSLNGEILTVSKARPEVARGLRHSSEWNNLPR